jgi:Galactose oxidase, central domain
LTGRLNAARYGHTATLLADGKVLVVGGSDDGDLASTLASAEIYDPDTGTWSTTGSLNTSRYNHTATLLPDGKVLVAGGYDWPPASLNSVELYDPSMGTWSIIGNLNAARDTHTATLLPGGRVLLAGGYDWYRRSSPTTTELYDAAIGTWSTMASINTSRRAHTATLLLNGKILITGGANWNDSLNSTELFDPGLAQSEPGAGVGTRLLIPSSVYSEQFVSSLVILNMDSESKQRNHIRKQSSE